MYFKKLTIQLFIILIFNFSVSFADSGFVRYMPDSVKTITNPADLEPYLESSDPLTKRWGIERMGQIGSSENIPQLMEIYDNTPFSTSNAFHRGKDLKDRILMAIGEIGGPEAESALFGILNQLDVHNISTPDSLDIIIYSCYAFAEMSSSNALNWLNNIYTDTLLGYGYRANALEAIYHIELGKPEYSSAKDTVEFLLDKLSKNFSSRIQQIEDFIITNAVSNTLYNISSPEIYDELSLQSEKLSEDIKQNWHFKYLKSGVKKISDSPYKRKWRW